MFRFMLAPSKSVELHQVPMPCIASPKMDGIRAGQINRFMISRTLKPFPNYDLHIVFTSGHREGWDGELVSGPPNAPDVFNRTQSQVMSRDGGTAGLTWYVFDNFSMPTRPFVERHLSLPEYELGIHIKRLEHTPIHTREELVAYEEARVSEGYEGIMVRDPVAHYREGRSTLNEGYLLKVKRLLDAEWIVVDFIELEKNVNELTRDERGYAKRSSHQAGKILMGTLGAMVVEMNDGTQFKVGIFKGFTKGQLQIIWNHREQCKGRRGKFQYLPSTKDLPRSARFVGWREANE